MDERLYLEAEQVGSNLVSLATESPIDLKIDGSFLSLEVPTSLKLVAYKFLNVLPRVRMYVRLSARSRKVQALV